MSAIIWGDADPPRKRKGLGGGETTEAKQLNGIGAKASAQNTLKPRPATSFENGGRLNAAISR